MISQRLLRVAFGVGLKVSLLPAGYWDPQGTAFFFGGIFIVLLGWSVVGMFVEMAGAFFLFRWRWGFSLGVAGGDISGLTLLGFFSCILSSLLDGGAGSLAWCAAVAFSRRLFPWSNGYPS